MTTPTGNEVIQALGVTPTGFPSGQTEQFTLQQIANLAGAGGGGTTTTRVIASGASDTAGASDVLIAWNSATTGAKAQTIPAPTTKGRTIIICDEVGTANTYNITITPAAGTIQGGAAYVMNGQYESVTLVADGTSNWIVT